MPKLTLFLREPLSGDLADDAGHQMGACYNKQVHFYWRVYPWQQTIDDLETTACNGTCVEKIEAPPAIARIVARIEQRAHPTTVSKK